MKDSYSLVRSTPPLSPAKLRPEQKITPVVPKPQITQIVQPRKQEIVKGMSSIYKIYPLLIFKEIGSFIVTSTL